ncbi:hypothetical protein [Halomonas sp. LBP4]|uniref:hypothetical protein n=1 Tax=Halomonas sp. LBP4 TaxID=2044917 RepID=UPI000D763813|nr:hypothetical protein [Halomonas sp. LBP4]PXX98332.1 hypothetical protein CR157_08430 [Halomonas sp. LBP4]
MRAAKVMLAGLALSVAGLAPADEAQRFPDVVGVEVTEAGENSFDFDVTLSSPYDSPSRYADAFRVLGPGDEELGVRELLHHHAGEQPFTRRLAGVEIPAEIDSVTVQGRDQEHGYGGEAQTVTLPGRQGGDE